MAKAQAGKTYAVIQDGRCHWIFSSVELPEWNEGHIQVVEVTDNVPNVGDDWNGSAFVPHVKTSDELAATAKAVENAALNAERIALKADLAIQSFVNMIPAQVIADVAAISNLAEAKQAIRRLSLMLLVVAKREFK